MKQWASEEDKIPARPVHHYRWYRWNETGEKRLCIDYLVFGISVKESPHCLTIEETDAKTVQLEPSKLTI